MSKAKTRQKPPRTQRDDLKCKVCDATYSGHVATKYCEACRDTGFRGRLGIFEILQITPKLRGPVERNEGTEAIHQLALEEGLITLRDDGIRKATEGQTTLSEVLAATARG